MEPFDRRESQVRSYCRAFPTVFDTARGCTLTDTDGRTYLDLLDANAPFVEANVSDNLYEIVPPHEELSPADSDAPLF